MKAINTEMVNELIRISESAVATRDKHQIDAYVSGLRVDQQAEFLGLMWYGRNDAIDGPIPFAEQVEFAKAGLEDPGSYMATKYLVLAGYLRNGLKLLKERGE